MSSFCKCKSYSPFFFSKIISIYAIFDAQNFNDTLTNDIVSFEQLGPGILPQNLRIFLQYSRLSLSRIPRDSEISLRYPYIDISDLLNLGKNEQQYLTNVYVI